MNEPLNTAVETGLTPVIAEWLAREYFEKVMAGKVKNFTRSSHGKRVYANDRTEGKFQGFYAALQAVQSGAIPVKLETP